jgi:hypothetical protein
VRAHTPKDARYDASSSSVFTATMIKSTATIPARIGCASALAPALARMKGLSYLDEMLDVVDFGVATRGAQESISQRLKHPGRLCIQRSAIKIDGQRKRWNCDKEHRLDSMESAVAGHLRFCTPVVAAACSAKAQAQAAASIGRDGVSCHMGPKRRR